MTRSYRALTRLLTVIPAVGLFLLINVNPFAQSQKLPAPGSYVSDFAGVIDADTKARIENLLNGLKEKSKVELYIAIVDSTGAQTSRGKTLLLVISAASKSSFTQFSRAAQPDLPDGVLGEMSYRMNGPLNDGRFS